MFYCIWKKRRKVYIKIAKHNQDDKFVYNHMDIYHWEFHKIHIVFAVNNHCVYWNICLIEKISYSVRYISLSSSSSYFQLYIHLPSLLHYHRPVFQLMDSFHPHVVLEYIYYMKVDMRLVLEGKYYSLVLNNDYHNIDWMSDKPNKKCFLSAQAIPRY